MFVNPEKNYNQNQKIKKGSFISKMKKAICAKDNTQPIITNISDEVDLDTINLLDEIERARVELLNATANFEYANEKEIIDYYTYEIKACEARYQYLIKKAKEKGLKENSNNTLQLMSLSKNIIE